MTRNEARIAVRLLPSYLRDLTDAGLVALALEAQAQVTNEAAQGDHISPVVRAGIEAQVAVYNRAAAETREFAKSLATVHDPNADGTL